MQVKLKILSSAWPIGRFYKYRRRKAKSWHKQAKAEFVKSKFKKDGGEVEVESYFGGRRKCKRGRGVGAKIWVIAVISRKGKVYAKVVERTEADTLNSFINNTISIDSLANTIESFWAYAKKAFRLTHRGVKKYFSGFGKKLS